MIQNVRRRHKAQQAYYLWMGRKEKPMICVVCPPGPRKAAPEREESHLHAPYFTLQLKNPTKRSALSLYSLGATGPKTSVLGGRKTWSGLREDHLLLVQHTVFRLCQRITCNTASQGHLWRPCGYYDWHSAGKPRRLTLAMGTMPRGMVYSRLFSVKPANKQNKAQRKI